MRRHLLQVLLPLVPPLALLSGIAAYGVNVPRWDEWGLISYALKLHDGTLGFSDLWMQHNEHRLLAVKVVAAPVVLATDFDLKAMMYAGFALQLLALAFLCAVLRITVPASDRPLAVGLPFAVALLMFSPAQHENWLWGLTSLQWHLCNLTAAAAVWVLARRAKPLIAFTACLLLAAAGMLSVASGIVLWGVVLVAIVTEGVVGARRPAAWLLAAWVVGAVALAGAYFSGFRPNAASDPSYFLAHPLQYAAFVLVYLGSPIVPGFHNSLATGIVGLLGVGAYVGAFLAALRGGDLTPRRLPWLWLSTHAVLVALVTGAGRTQFGILTATTNRYTTGALLFWIGLLVIAAMTLRQASPVGRASFVTRALAAVLIGALALGALNYVRLYRDGYRQFVQIHHDRRVALAELWELETAPDEALSYLYPPSAKGIRADARILEARGLGPFSPRMARQRARRDEIIATAGHAAAGAGSLDVAQCEIIAGWAWDPQQPETPVKVDIYEGEERLATVPAYWYRDDLQRHGIGDGRHGYVYTPPARLKDGREHVIRARVAGTGNDLTNSPRAFVCSDPNLLLWR